MKSPTTAFTAASCTAIIFLFSALVQSPAAERQTGTSETGITALDQEFRELPPEARRQVGPLF